MANLWLKIISVVEIVGGVSGLYVAAREGLAHPQGGAVTILILLVFAGINLLSIYAGVALWLGRSSGRIASIIVQALQLPKIFSPVVIYVISIGFDVWFQFLTRGQSYALGFELRVLSSVQFVFNAQGAPLGCGISLVSCVFLAMLLRYSPGVSLPESKHPAAADDNQQEGHL